MQIEQKTISRLEQLIQIADVILQNSGIEYSHIGNNKIPVKILDSAKAIQWRMSCLQILIKDFGKDSHYYIEFEKNSDALSSWSGYDQIKECLAIIKAAKEDYENSYHSKAKEIEKSKSPTLMLNNENNYILKNCDKEVERNARIYLMVILVFVLLLAFALNNFGVIYAASITIGLLIVGYCLSLFFLKEWTPAKLHERILELEKERIYKRFGIDIEK